MSKEARQRAGLGNPPAPYYTNIPECANALIKQSVGFKENEMTKFCQEMSVMLSRQKVDVESAILNHGPYRLAPKFAHLEVPQQEWFSKSTAQKESCVAKFHNAKISGDGLQTGDAPQPQIAAQIESRVQLTVDLKSQGITCISPTTLQYIAEKAESILNKDNAIVQAPGSADAFMVESTTMVRPHYVTKAKNGKITCSDCPNWKAYKLCAHSLAVGEKTRTTLNYLQWFKRNGPSRVNLANLITCDSGKGVGKKGTKSSTARRKGGRSGKTAPTTIVDRLSGLSNSVSTPAPISSAGNPNSTTNPNLHNRAEATVLQPPMPPVIDNTVQYLPSAQYLSTAPLRSETQHSATSSCPRPDTTTAHGFSVNLLQFCPHLVRSCYGCTQPLKPGGFIAIPPYDLVIMSRMNREFRDPVTGVSRSKEGNVYFHVHLDCLRRKQPYFNPQMAVVPRELFQHLRPEHICLLQQFGALV